MWSCAKSVRTLNNRFGAGLERASADLAKYRTDMEGAVRAAESRVEFSSNKFNRKQELLAQKYVSAYDRDEATTEKRLAESELITVRDNRRVSDLEYRHAMEDRVFS